MLAGLVAVAANGGRAGRAHPRRGHNRGGAAVLWLKSVANPRQSLALRIGWPACRPARGRLTAEIVAEELDAGSSAGSVGQLGAVMLVIPPQFRVARPAAHEGG
jgi:hypothetical protein